MSLLRRLPGLHDHVKDGSKKISRPSLVAKSGNDDSGIQQPSAYTEAPDRQRKPRSLSVSCTSSSAIVAVATISANRSNVSYGDKAPQTPSSDTHSDTIRILQANMRGSAATDEQQQLSSSPGTKRAVGLRLEANSAPIAITVTGAEPSSDSPRPSASPRPTDSPRATDSPREYITIQRTASSELFQRQRVNNSFRVSASSDAHMQRILDANRNGGKMLEFFAICGLNQWEAASGDAKPKVLYAIRRNGETVDASLPMFCFHTGAVTNAEIDVMDSKRLLYEALRRLPLPDEMLYDAAHAFVFTLTDSKSQVIYCLCMLHSEVLEQVPAVMQAGTTETPVINVPLMHITRRAYCLASRFPYFTLMWQMLGNLLRNEHNRMITSYTPNNGQAELREHLDKARSFTKLVRGMLGLVPPLPGSSAKYESHALTSVLYFSVPRDADNGANMMVASLCMRALLRALSAPVLVRILAAMLTECNVLLHSTTPGRLSACAFAILSLLKPFDWCHVAVPVLPAHLAAMIQAPMSVFLGIVLPPDATQKNSEPLRIITELLDNTNADNYTVSIDLDRNVFSCSAAAKRIALPLSDRVVALFATKCTIVRTGMTQLSGMCADPNPWEPRLSESDGFLPIVVNTLEEFSQYKLWLINTIRRMLPLGCYPSEQAITEETLRNQISNLFPERYRQFFRVFMNTQTYIEVAKQFGSMSDCNTATDIEGVFKGAKLE